MCVLMTSFSTMRASRLYWLSYTAPVNIPPSPSANETNQLIFLQIALNEETLGVSYESNPLAFCMKIWVAADYFAVPSLLDNLQKLVEDNVTIIGRQLAQPGANSDWVDLAVDTGRNNFDEMLYDAIDQLELYRAAENYSAVETFQPTVLRLILCGRHRFSTRNLCQTHPELVEGWETVLNRRRLTYPHYARPAPHNQCQRCNKFFRATSPDEKDVAVILDMVRREMGGWLQWYCQECYTVPLLEEWDEVGVMYRLDKQEAALKQEYEERRRVLLKQRMESSDRLDAARQRAGSSNDYVWEQVEDNEAETG